MAIKRKFLANLRDVKQVGFLVDFIGGIISIEDIYDFDADCDRIVQKYKPREGEEVTIEEREMRSFEVTLTLAKFIAKFFPSTRPASENSLGDSESCSDFLSLAGQIDNRAEAAIVHLRSRTAKLFMAQTIWEALGFTTDESDKIVIVLSDVAGVNKRESEALEKISETDDYVGKKSAAIIREYEEERSTLLEAVRTPMSIAFLTFNNVSPDIKAKVLLAPYKKPADAKRAQKAALRDLQRKLVAEYRNKPDDFSLIGHKTLNNFQGF